MTVLFRCDQCSYEEWREAHEEPWLCVVCGNMRWGVVAGDDSAASTELSSFEAESHDIKKEKDR